MNVARDTEATNITMATDTTIAADNMTPGEAYAHLLARVTRYEEANERLEQIVATQLKQQKVSEAAWRGEVVAAEIKADRYEEALREIRGIADFEQNTTDGRDAPWTRVYHIARAALDPEAGTR